MPIPFCVRTVVDEGVRRWDIPLSAETVLVAFVVRIRFLIWVAADGARSSVV